MYRSYQIFLFILLLIASPYLLVRAIFGGHGLKERLGMWKFKSDDRKVVWFHAASMGELKVISSILPELIALDPDLRVIISTITKTGHDKAAKLFAPVEVFYLPLDLRCCVKRVFESVKPSLLVLIETEIWPILISQAKLANSRVAIINGRLSDKSFKLYKIFRGLFSSTINKMDHVLAQTEENSQRFIQLGADHSRVSNYGNIKFDQVLNQDKKPLPAELESYLNGDDRFIFIAGSIWPDEFAGVIDAVKTVMINNDKLISILAPRHLKNLGKLEEALASSGLPYFRRSRMDRDISNARLMILDTMGELSSLYRYASLAFVGGSFVNIGGHDPLEPASAGCPVCFGPNMQNSRIFADILVDAGGAFYLSDIKDLKELLEELINNQPLAKELGEKAHKAVMEHSGVSRQIAGKLAEYI